jgi:Uncharacterized protein conserved in bacteria
MIVYDLACDNGHVFEAWFKDSATYERQVKKKLISCALCGSAKIRKAPMAPRIRRGKGEGGRGAESGAAPTETYATDPRMKRVADLMKELAALRKHVEENAEYVGNRFAEEARKMHYGEKERRSIYGEASNQEARELAEEGIEFTRIPWIPRHDA